MMRRQKLPVASPRGGNRGCLCPDGTYSRKCCDGSLPAQGIGSLVQQGEKVEPSDIWFNFNGSTNYAYYPEDSFSFSGTAYSFAFYIRTFDVTRSKQYILQADNFSIELQHTNLVLVQGSNTLTIGTILINDWTYVAITIDGSNIVAYAIPDDSLPPNIVSGTLAGINLNAVNDLRIGAGLDGSSPFIGNFAYFGFWQRVLTEAEVISLEPKTLLAYTTSEKVDLIHFYEFSYWLEFSVLNLANDLIGVPPINGTINDL
jgi:hypothetical protein